MARKPTEVVRLSGYGDCDQKTSLILIEIKTNKKQTQIFLHSDGSYISVDLKQLIKLKVHWIQHITTEGEKTYDSAITFVFLKSSRAS